VLSQEDRDNQWSSANMAHYGYSFWWVADHAVLHIIYSVGNAVTPALWQVSYVVCCRFCGSIMAKILLWLVVGTRIIRICKKYFFPLNLSSNILVHLNSSQNMVNYFAGPWTVKTQMLHLLSSHTIHHSNFPDLQLCSNQLHNLCTH
jgi:hypothetical protein